MGSDTDETSNERFQSATKLHISENTNKTLVDSNEEAKIMPVKEHLLDDKLQAIFRATEII
jgi:hypothetical protein